MQAGVKTNEANYFIKLFRGDIPLYITFWIYGILIGRLMYLMSEYIFRTNDKELWLIDVVTILYYIFIYIAIWRSANKYQGKKNWGEAAKVYVVLSIFITFSGLYRALY
jgi:hypothetical protein